MNVKTFALMALFLFPVLAYGAEPAKILSVDSIQVLKIAPQDGRAVVKTPDGKMQIIKAGDPIGDHARVTEIAAGRVVIEETKGKEPEQVIIRLENGKQHVERLKKTGDVQRPAFSAKTLPPPVQPSSAPNKQSAKAKKEKKTGKRKKGKTNKEKSKEKRVPEKNNKKKKIRPASRTLISVCKTFGRKAVYRHFFGNGVSLRVSTSAPMTAYGKRCGTERKRRGSEWTRNQEPTW